MSKQRRIQEGGGASPSEEAAFVMVARFQVGDLVVLDGHEVLKVIAVNPATKARASAKDSAKPSYTLRHPRHHRWEKHAGEDRLQPVSEVIYQPPLFDLEV